MTQGNSIYAQETLIRLDDKQTPFFQDSDTIEYGGSRALVTRLTETHGPFQLIGTTSWKETEGTVHHPRHQGVHGVVHRPPHPTVEPHDVLSANYAWQDDDGYWHFAPCSPDVQVNFADEVEDFAASQFNRAIMKSNAKMAQGTVNHVRTTAFAKSTALLEVSESLGRWCHDRVIKAALGHWHKNPEVNYRRAITVVGLDFQLAQMRQLAPHDPAVRAKLGRVQAEINAIRTRLTSEHDILRRALFEAEQAAEGIDPIGGREYIYTQSADGTAISGAANLPDPAWVFDSSALASGVVRGGQTYYDGEQDGTESLPFAIRFSRPIPANAVRNTSIGSVQWEQDDAERVYEED